jgi:hypothetical protein
MPLSVLRLYSFNDMTIRECGGETEELGENLSQCHTVHHKSHMTCPGIEPGLWLELQNVPKLLRTEMTSRPRCSMLSMTLMMTIITNSNFFNDILFSLTNNDHCRKPTQL